MDGARSLCGGLKVGELQFLDGFLGFVLEGCVGVETPTYRPVVIWGGRCRTGEAADKGGHFCRMPEGLSAGAKARVLFGGGYGPLRLRSGQALDSLVKRPFRGEIGPTSSWQGLKLNDELTAFIGLTKVMPLLQNLQGRTVARVYRQARPRGYPGRGLTRNLCGSPRGIVDSGAGIGYSGLLARCCAWGLCVCTRTGWTMPLVGVGWSRPRAQGCVGTVTNPAEPEPSKGPAGAVLTRTDLFGCG